MSAFGRGPTIVLVGGRMTVDDGTSFDSRQLIENDESSEVTLRSLSMSYLWWQTTISLVMPILEGAGEGAFALVIGQRSVVDLRQDGTFRRTLLRKVLPGRTTQVDVVRTNIRESLPDGYELARVLRDHSDENIGKVGYRGGAQSERWCFLNGESYYLTQVGPDIGPTVIVDTTPWLLDNYRAHRLGTLESSRLFSPDIVLVVPHTFSADQYFETYVEWAERGRPPDAPGVTEEPSVWDPNAWLEPVHYATPVPIAADFGVTGLVVDAKWEEPADLEAARSLLQARYDLKIGIWDLASNPTLRDTLLDITPVLPAPSGAVEVPAGAAKRAETKVDTKMAARTAEKQALATVSAQLADLKSVGWMPGEGFAILCLPLTELFTGWWDHKPFPLVRLELSVIKRSTAVSVFMILYNQISLSDYVRRREEELIRIAGAEACPLGTEHKMARTVLWNSAGGWGDDVKWSERAHRLADLSPRWAEVFADLCEECRRVRRESGYPDS